jgi:tetratricopeptide (TPR) repeat protein
MAKRTEDRTATRPGQVHAIQPENMEVRIEPHVAGAALDDGQQSTLRRRVLGCQPLFGERGFEREIDSAATRFFSLSSVIGDRRGNCLGLGALYLAIGERIGLPLDGILLPGHFFVRTRGQGRHNVELLRRGETMPDTWYRQKYGPWPEPGSAYFRPLTVTELVAIHWFNRGNDLQASGDLAAAESAYARAAQEFPDFAEAHASLGAARQRRGAFTEAEVAYREAARVWPDLPGLAGNLDLLRQQLAGATALSPQPDRP